MSLFLDIGTGAGLAGASGVRPFLPPLLAGALARGGIGIDFRHTSYSFLQSPAFLVAVLALAALAYLLERRRPAASARDPVELGLAALGVALGALLFAGAVSQAHAEAWPFLFAGAACAALGFLAVAALVGRARRRVEGSAASLLLVYADLISLLLAGLAILLAPLGLVALVAFAVLLTRARMAGPRKFEGLRILR